MKRFLRHVNLGLVLGGVLILVTLLVILITQVVFQFEKPDIRDAARDYLDDLAALNVSPVSANAGTPLNNTQAAEKKAEFEAFLKEHWHSEPMPPSGTTDLLFGSTSLTMEDVRASYYSYLEIPVQAIFYEVSFSVLDSDITIQENGPGYARVAINVSDATAVCWGDPNALFTAGDPYFFTGDPESYPSAYELAQAYGTEPYTVRYELYLELEMKRVDGEWRVINARSNSYPIYEVTIIEPKEGN